MRSDAADGLGSALDLVYTTLYQAPVASASVAAQDPLAINLPPLGPGGMPVAVDAGSLRTLATLYFQAELEQAGLIPVAELLAEERASLVVGAAATAGRLEDFYRHSRSRNWYDRATRNRLFARLFGMGPAVNDEAGSAINRDFLRRLATLCSAINQLALIYQFGQTPDATADEVVRYEATEILNNLGPRQYGNALLAAQIIQDELQEAIALLSDPGVEFLFGGHGLWDTLRKIMGDQAPDLDRLVNLGQNGIRLLNWLASVIPQLGDGTSSRPLLPPGSPVFTWAAAWLAATGLGTSLGHSAPVQERQAADLQPVH